MVFKIAFVLVVVVAGFFIYRAMTLQSQVTQSKSDNEQMQVQLQQARGDFEKAQANARQLSGETAKLQSQVEQAQSESASAKANAEKATAQVAGLQTQLNQARSEAAAAKANAERSAGEIRKLQAQLQAQTQAQPEAQAPVQAQAQAAKPAAVEPAAVAPAVGGMKMPLNVSFEKALVGEGNWLVLRNAANSSLPVIVKFTDATASKSKEFRLVLNAGASKELGSLGGWNLSSGDKVQIESANYETIVKTAP